MMKSANWQEFLLPTLRKIFDKHIGQKKDFVPVIYSIESSTKAQEFMHGIGSMGEMDKWSDTGNQVSYETIDKGFKATWTHDKWSKGLRIEKELLEDALYPEVKNRTKKLADSVYYTRQRHAAMPFNNCLTVLGPDGKALAATDHPIGPGSSETWSNYKTGMPLNEDSLEEIRNLMMEWTDDKGNEILIEPDTLIVPRRLRKAALTVADTDKKPDSAENNVNIWHGAVKVIEWDFLKDSNTWFFVDSNRMNQYMIWFERRKATLAADKEDFDSEVAKYKVVGRWSFGPAETSFFYACRQH